jgi:serine phosphatase RsbU (regulator of sigma subunit)
MGIFTAALVFMKAESQKRMQLVGTIVILALFLSTNIEQLMTQNSALLKNIFDWRNQVLIPGLVFIAFIDIGSIYNTIQRVSKIVKQKAEMDKEIEISKSIQFSNLPESKSKSGDWRWHGLYKPASILAGDWYDVRELALSDHRTILVAAMVDVTGHGISAAMMTSNIASHWSLWTRGVLQHESNLEAYLQLAPQRIHEGLIGLRSNLGCSMAAIIFDQSESKLYYTTAGHPGILSGSEIQFRYHVTSGSRPGSPSENAAWEAKTTTLEPQEDMIVLYTDGIVPPGVAASQWLGRVKQEMRRSQTGLLRQIAGQILANSRSFRKSPEVEDDLTILILKKEKLTS